MSPPKQTPRADIAAKDGAERAMAQRSSFAAERPQEILLPAKPWFVLFTLICGLVANAMPASGVALLLKPDFLALILLYWCIQEPRLISVGIAWCLGLLMDVTDATVFGQHALAYAVLAYAAEYFRRRVLRFPLWQQAAQVAFLLLGCSALVLLIRFVGGATLPRWTYAVGPLVGALLWPLVTVALQLPQRPRRSQER
jgi:rod shape-determining protein MreD